MKLGLFIYMYYSRSCRLPSHPGLVGFFIGSCLSDQVGIPNAQREWAMSGKHELTCYTLSQAQHTSLRGDFPCQSLLEKPSTTPAAGLFAWTK